LSGRVVALAGESAFLALASTHACFSETISFCTSPGFCVGYLRPQQTQGIDPLEEILNSNLADEVQIINLHCQ